MRRLPVADRAPTVAGVAVRQRDPKADRRGQPHGADHVEVLPPVTQRETTRAHIAVFVESPARVRGLPRGGIASSLRGEALNPRQSRPAPRPRGRRLPRD